MDDMDDIHIIQFRLQGFEGLSPVYRVELHTGDTPTGD